MSVIGLSLLFANFAHTKNEKQHSCRKRSALDYSETDRRTDILVTHRWSRGTPAELSASCWTRSANVPRVALTSWRHESTDFDIGLAEMLMRQKGIKKYYTLFNVAESAFRKKNKAIDSIRLRTARVLTTHNTPFTWWSCGICCADHGYNGVIGNT